ncbi:MAG: MFS transporter [Chloroflexi bacterium]|nr:MFS transporter [Chloroflexota bacterium]
MTGERGAPGWQRNLYVLALGQFLSTVAFSSTVPLLPLLVQELGIRVPSEASFWAGVAQFISGFCAFLVGPVWGTLADRYGRKTMVLRSTIGGAFVLALAGLSPSVSFLIVTRAIHGTLSGVNTAASALAASEAPSARLPFALGVIQMAFFLGTMGGPLVGGVLADAFGYRVPYFVMGGVLAVAFFVVLLFVHENFEPAKEAGPQLHPVQSVRLVLGMPNVVPLLGMLMVIRFGPFMLQPILAIFMQGMVPEGAATAAGVALSLLGLASAFAAVLIGRWGRPDRLLIAVLFASWAASVLYLPQVWVQSGVLSVALFGLLGLCQGTLLTSTNSLLSASVSREHQGIVFGVVQSASALAQGTAALVAGTMTIALGVRSVFAADTALFFLLGVAAWWMLKRGQREVHAVRKGAGAGRA